MKHDIVHEASRFNTRINSKRMSVVACALFVGALLYYYHASAYPYGAQLKQDIHVDRRVTSVITNGSPIGTSSIKIFGLGGRYKSIGYGFRYDTDGLRINISTIDHPLDVTGKDEVEFKLYLGMCVDSVCTPDPHVTDRWVLLEYTDLSGKKILTGTP